MTCRSRTTGISGVVLGLVAMSAMAAPPLSSNTSRTYGNEVYANVCTDVPIQRCADVSAWENYDNRCDAFWNCEWTPLGFPEPTVVTGEWIKPMNASKAVVNRTDSFYDPWSETSYKTVNHCNENWGDLMSKGGFTFDLGTRVRHFPFEGFDAQG